MFLFKNEDREIFSIHINYRYAEKHGISNEDFIRAHLAEHLMLVNVCRQMQSRFGDFAYIEKYVSGLTNIENSCFHLSASNEYISYVSEYIGIVCNHQLDHINENDFLEQVENVLREYEYPDDSYRGRCDAFYTFINSLENIDFEEELYKITFDEIKEFIDERFVINNCDIFYCGKINEEIKREALQWAKHTKLKPTNTLLPIAIKRNEMMVNDDQKKQVWFAYRFLKLKTFQDYIISEIVAKTIQIVIALANKITLDNPIINVGTHYTGNCAYALFYANAIYDDLSFGYSREQIHIIIEAVKEEYKTRLLLKNDSLLEMIKFYKKIFYITTEDITSMDIKCSFEKIEEEEIYNRFEEVYTGDKIILEYI